MADVAAEAENLPLGGIWRLARAGEAAEVPCPVPGDVHSALLAAGRISDPLLGENERDVQWVGTADWVLHRSFEVPAEAIEGRWPVLDLVGVDTVARVTAFVERVAFKAPRDRPRGSTAARLQRSGHPFPLRRAGSGGAGGPAALPGALQPAE